MISPRPLRIGLTGGIAMGKSTVAEVFRQNGDYVIDADDVTKSIYSEQEFLYKLKKRIPNALCNRQVNFVYLRQAIQTNPPLLDWLEEYIHPKIYQKFEHSLATTHCKPHTCIVGVVPLLFEKGFVSLFDRVLVVSVDATTQQKRIRARPNMTNQWMQFILSRQWSDAKRRHQADSIIAGDLSLCKLKQHVMAIRTQWLHNNLHT